MALSAMFQRTFDFDRPILRDDEQDTLAKSLHSLPAEFPRSTLIRPDRQLIYSGVHHYEWPPPYHDHDTITVDRIRDDIDGPPHRFVVKRGDKVEVFLACDRVEVGKVTGIRHDSNEVRVSFRTGWAGLWLSKERIYPLPRR